MTSRRLSSSAGLDEKIRRYNALKAEKAARDTERAGLEYQQLLDRENDMDWALQASDEQKGAHLARKNALGSMLGVPPSQGLSDPVPGQFAQDVYEGQRLVASGGASPKIIALALIARYGRKWLTEQWINLMNMLAASGMNVAKQNAGIPSVRDRMPAQQVRLQADQSVPQIHQAAGENPETAQTEIPRTLEDVLASLFEPYYQPPKSREKQMEYFVSLMDSIMQTHVANPETGPQLTLAARKELLRIGQEMGIVKAGEFYPEWCADLGGQRRPSVGDAAIDREAVLAGDPSISPSSNAEG